MKRYYSANLVLENIAENLTRKEDVYERIMKEKPNFNKRDNSKVIYRKKEFIIIKAKNSFIIINKEKEFKKGHTHTNNYNYAKSLIDLSVRKKAPNKPKKRIIDSLIRINKDEKYLKKLLKIKGGFKNEYTNEKGK